MWILAKSSDALRRPEQLLFSYPLLSTYPYASGAALSSSVRWFLLLLTVASIVEIIVTAETTAATWRIKLTNLIQSAVHNYISFKNSWVWVAFWITGKVYSFGSWAMSRLSEKFHQLITCWIPVPQSSRQADTQTQVKTWPSSFGGGNNACSSENWVDTRNSLFYLLTIFAPLL